MGRRIEAPRASGHAARIAHRCRRNHSVTSIDCQPSAAAPPQFGQRGPFESTKRFLAVSPVTFSSPSTRKWATDVSQARQLKQLATVAVLERSGEPEVHSGDVGTVVELLPDGGLEVEFLNPDGRTRHVGTLSTDNVLVVNRGRTRVA